MVFVELSIFLSCCLVYKVFQWYQQRVRVHKTFKNVGIEGPKPSLITGNWTEYRETDNPSNTIEKWLGQYGDVFGYFLGERPFLVINDLKVLQKIFLTNASIFRNRLEMALDAKPISVSIFNLKDERWKASRRLISPTFSHTKVTSSLITKIIHQCIDNVLNALPKANGEPFVVDVYEKMQAYTLDVIARTSLNMESDVHNANNSLMNATREYFKFAGNKAVDMALFFGFLRPILTFINNNLTAGKMMDMIVEHVRKQIKDILEGKVKLVDSKYQNFLVSMLSHLKNGTTTEEELMGNVAIIMLAGYETTANSVTYTLYLLAKNPEIQEKLRSEINEKQCDSEYLEMVWLESLRYYPPVTLFLLREASEDVTIDGIFIKKGVTVQAPVWHIHHRPDIWEDPFVFNPERFSKDRRDSIPPAAFLTFGLGPRTCLGNHLATWEAKQMLVALLSRFRVEFCDETRDPLPLTCPTAIINPAVPVYLRFVPITK